MFQFILGMRHGVFVKQKCEQKGSKKVSSISTTKNVSETSGGPTLTFSCANRASPFVRVRRSNAHDSEHFFTIGGM